MLADISPQQFDEWIAIYGIEPWGDDWNQTAMIVAEIHNRALAKDQLPMDPRDVVPTLENRRKLREAAEQSQGSGLSAVWENRINQHGRK